MIKTEILKQLNHQFSENKKHAELLAENNLFQALKNQDFAYLDNQINALTIEIAKAEYDNNIQLANKYKQTKQELITQQEKILETMNLTLKDLKPQYACFMCQDTGFIKG